MDYSQIPTDEIIAQTAAAVEKRGVKVIIVENKEAALAKVKETIAAGSKVMNGSSVTLQEIGYMDYLKSGAHPWVDLHAQTDKENDMAKRGELRRRSVVDADYFLSSVNAVSQNGELIAVDNTGSRVTAFPFAAKKLLLIAGVQKIAPNLEEGMRRIREYVFPLEDAHMQELYHMGSGFGKWVIIEHERFPDRTTLILVKEKLGF
jgi:L-lactate utilization protein LutB